MGNKSEVPTVMHKHLSKFLAHSRSSIILPFSPDFLSFHFHVNNKHLLMCTGS